MDTLTIISLSFVFIESYLTANKLWSRKHKRDVAESISLAARSISIITLTLFILESYNKGHVQGFVSGFVWLSVVSFQILVGYGLWVKGVKGMGTTAKIKLFTLKELGELGNLIKGIINPSSEALMAKIIYKFALVDSNLDIKEQQLIDKFLKNWEVKIDWEKAKDENVSNINQNIIELRNLFTQYLDTSPPVKQAIQLHEIILLLMHVDDKIEESERLLSQELTILLDAYAGHSPRALYKVTVVPQTDAQRNKIPTIISDLGYFKHNYGDFFESKEAYSREYASLLCEEYKKMGFATFVSEAVAT